MNVPELYRHHNHCQGWRWYVKFACKELAAGGVVQSMKFAKDMFSLMRRKSIYRITMFYSQSCI